MTKNRKGETVTEFNSEAPCMGCGESTHWSDYICNDCERDIPEYIHSSQVDKYLERKKEKHEHRL